MGRNSLPIWMVLLACAAMGLAGCQTIDFYEQPPEEMLPMEAEPPREKALASLPAYRIEVPDVVQVEMLKQVPLPPYRVQSYDVLGVNVAGTAMAYPIGPYDADGQPTESGGNYLVEAEGNVNLGAPYGKVRVLGMTIEEARLAVEKHLRQMLEEPVVSVQLARSSGTQPVTAEYLVGPDGTINLRLYGSVCIAGLTIAEAKTAIEKHMARYFDSPEVSVNVVAFNSKTYYIITQGAGLGDTAVRIPITGKETVLDALSNIGGLTQFSSTNIWIARPAPAGFGCDQILPVDYEAITRGAITSTNYQLMPHDRLYIAEDKTVALGNMINVALGPVEKLISVASLSAQTMKNFQATGRSYNQRFRR